MPKPYTPNDRWSQKAAAEGYRARSVYKLMELDETFHLLKPGMTVVDLGAAPGSWLQYVAKKIGPEGRAYGFDLQKIEPVAQNVTTFVADITDHFAIGELLRKVGVREIDLLLSDAAPNTSGVKDVDQWKSVELAQASLALAKEILRPNGHCALKVFRGADFDEFFAAARYAWQDVSMQSVEASRDRSREVYVILRRPSI